MDLSYLTAEDWKEFDERYPQAASFLRAKSIETEHLTLTKDLNCPDGLSCEEASWKKSRLNELEKVNLICAGCGRSINRLIFDIMGCVRCHGL